MESIHKLIKTGNNDGLTVLLSCHSTASDLVNQADETGDPPLLTALRVRPVDPQTIRILLDAGADIKSSRHHEYKSPFEGMDIEPDVMRANLGFDFPDFDFAAVSYTESAIQLALASGSLEVVKLFVERGTDFCTVDENGHSAILNALYTDPEPTEIIEFLLRLGAAPDTASRFGEVPVQVALRFRWFEVLKVLEASGADMSPLTWTPLIRAAAYGNRDAVEAELSHAHEINARAATGHSALHVALMRGDEAIVQLLLKAGASVEKAAKEQPSCLLCACASGKKSLVLEMLQAGCLVDEEDEYGSVALSKSVAQGYHEIVKVLIEHGADPSSDPAFVPIIEEATDPATIKLLLEMGADPAGLGHQGRRILLGLSGDASDWLDEVTKDQYFGYRYEREGTSNPEDITDPFRIAMIRAGCNAYRARQHFGDDAEFSCGLSWDSRPPQVWCFDRFGTTFTQMPDGRTILIAGEHEDSYDPDFCIYNDVTVFFPDGSIRIFSYPRNRFEPTDFHTATLIGHNIWIIGGLGYPNQRGGPIPVYRLDTRDYSITRIKTKGQTPTRIYRHRAFLNNQRIKIIAGTRIEHESDREEHVENRSIYHLDALSKVWTKIS